MNRLCAEMCVWIALGCLLAACMEPAEPRPAPQRSERDAQCTEVGGRVVPDVTVGAFHAWQYRCELPLRIVVAAE